MYTDIQKELDSHAKLLWLIHREMGLQVKKEDVSRALEATIHNISSSAGKVPPFMAQVRGAAGESIRLAREALSILENNGSIYADPQVVVEGLLTAARARLQWAAWAVEQANGPVVVSKAV